MQVTPFRVLAAILCCQPILWMSNVALAQTFEFPGTLDPFPGSPTGPATGLGGSAELGGGLFQQGARQGLSAQQSPRSPVPETTAPIDEPVDPDKYVCGPGDVFELNFWGLQNFKLRVTV